MSKYAVIKVGSSQERVSVGDEFSVSSSFEEKTVVPVLVSPRKGQIVVDDKELKNYKVELAHLSSSKSKKINIFQYKNKTGNRRRESRSRLCVHNCISCNVSSTIFIW